MPRRSSCSPETLLATQGLRGLQAMAKAALAVTDPMKRWAADGESVLHQLLGHQPPEAWKHFPEQDARDTRRGYRWYYHSHDTSERDGEHGHFHLFSEHPSGVRGGVTLTHLIAIGIDPLGLPTRVFTVNRWVTDEVWRDADQVVRLLTRFRVAGASGTAKADVGEWLAALVQIFEPQIRRTVLERDRSMRERASGGNRPNLRDDRRIEVISTCRVSLVHQIEAIDRRLAVARARSARKLKNPGRTEERAACA